jgi:predicted DsbA family dithiol-disulfide isomerase
MKKKLDVTIVSDIVCPWCLIGTRRLDEAIASLPDLDVTLHFRPFLLDPSTPDEGRDLRENLRRKFGDPEPMFRRVEAAAKESGIPLDFAKVKRSVSTIPAHTLLRHAEEKGTQAALKRALLGAYFLEGRDVSDEKELSAIASSHGFSASEVHALLTSEDEKKATREEADRARREGVTGVPFFVLDGRYAISGAQPVAIFRRALEQAADALPDSAE